jgi:CRP-like cAMP-binding protein
MQDQIDQAYRLIATKEFDKAVKVLRKLFEEHPDDLSLRQQLANVLPLVGAGEEAAELLIPVIEQLTAAGYNAKALALVKKVQRIDPSREGLDDMMAVLIKQQELEMAQGMAAPPQQSPGVASGQRPEAGPGDVPPPTPRELSRVGPEVKSQLIFDLDDLELEAEQPVKSPLFHGIPEGELKILLRAFSLVKFEPGEIVVTEGEPGDSLFLLTRGTVRVFVLDGNGSNVQVRTLQAGDFFGEIAILTGNTRTATVTTASRCEMLKLAKADVIAISEHHPSLLKVIQDYCWKRALSPEERRARHGAGTSPPEVDPQRQ